MPVKTRNRSQRYTLLLYQSSMDQIWPASLFFGLILITMWFFSARLLPYISPFQDAALFIGGVVELAIAVFAWGSRKGAYVQAFPDHFRLITPFLRLKISYRRIQDIRTTQFQALFSRQNVRLLDRGSLEPFFGSTVTLVQLSDYPLSLRTLRMFLSKYTFTPGYTGLVLLVDDWIGLSQDLDHFNLQWRQAQLQRRSQPAADTGLLGKLPN